MTRTLTFRYCLPVALLLALLAWPGDARAGRSTPPPPSAEPTPSPELPLAPMPVPTPGPLSLDLNDTPEVPIVLRVSRYVGDEKVPDTDTARDTVERGDDIYVHVQMLDAWIDSVKSQVTGGKASIVDLVLYLNGTALTGLHPNYSFPYREELNSLVDGKPVYSSRPVNYLRFHLECTPESKAAWQQLLRRPDFNRRVVEISVGFDKGLVMPTYVSANGRQPFYIVSMPPGKFWWGVGVIVACLVVFFWLAIRTDIIRDTGALVRPDERRPYSLGRTQMAFWFFLVLTSFGFLWVLTGEMDTLNTSVLALLGISVGTALGGALVDASVDPSRREKAGYRLPAVDLSRPDVEIRAQIGALVVKAEARLAAAEAASGTVPENDQAARKHNADDIEAADEAVRTLKRQREYFEWPAVKAVFYDLLMDNGFISFHRFQILVWTLVLGLMFVIGVYSETAMPEFNATLLGLLGISGGTYIGFKLPEPPVEKAGNKASG